MLFLCRSVEACIVVISTFVLGAVSSTVIYFRRQLEGPNATGKYAPLVAIAFPMLASIIGAVTATFTKITGMFLTQGTPYLQAHLGQLLFVSLTWVALFLISTQNTIIFSTILDVVAWPR